MLFVELGLKCMIVLNNCWYFYYNFDLFEHWSIETNLANLQGEGLTCGKRIFAGIGESISST